MNNKDILNFSKQKVRDANKERELVSKGKAWTLLALGSFFKFILKKPKNSMF